MMHLNFPQLCIMYALMGTYHSVAFMLSLAVFFYICTCCQGAFNDNLEINWHFSFVFMVDLLSVLYYKGCNKFHLFGVLFFCISLLDCS